MSAKSVLIPQYRLAQNDRKEEEEVEVGDIITIDSATSIVVTRGEGSHRLAGSVAINSLRLIAVVIHCYEEWKSLLGSFLVHNACTCFCSCCRP